TYLHSAIDGYSRLAYTEALEDETAQTTIGFFARARAYFAAHGITRLIRVVTDNGANYRASRFVRAVQSHASRHQRTRAYTPRHNGKVERYQRLLAEECLYARVYESEQARRRAIGVWVHHYNYHRPHTACADQPPASRVHERVDNVMTSYILAPLVTAMTRAPRAVASCTSATPTPPEAPVTTTVSPRRRCARSSMPIAVPYATGRAASSSSDNGESVTS